MGIKASDAKRGKNEEKIGVHWHLEEKSFGSGVWMPAAAAAANENNSFSFYFFFHVMMKHMK